MYNRKHVIIKSVLDMYYKGVYEKELKIAKEQLEEAIQADLSEFYPSRVSKWSHIPKSRNTEPQSLLRGIDQAWSSRHRTLSAFTEKQSCYSRILEMINGGFACLTLDEMTTIEEICLLGNNERSTAQDCGVSVRTIERRVSSTCRKLYEAYIFYSPRIFKLAVKESTTQ